MILIEFQLLLQITPPNRRWRISNEAVSLGHSVISGFWALYAIIVYPKLMEDMVNYTNTMAYYLVSFFICLYIINNERYNILLSFDSHPFMALHL